MNKTTQFILNIIVGFTSLVFFVILLFPLDAMIGHYLEQMEKSTKGSWRISVSNIDSSLIFDTQFKDFHLYKDGKEVFAAPVVSADISLFSLISGTVNLGFGAEYTQGDLSGRVVLASDSVVNLDIDNVSLNNLAIINNYLGSGSFPMTLSGRISGEVYFSWSQDARQKEVEVTLMIYDVQTSALSYKPLNIEIPELTLAEGKSALQIEGKLDKGEFELKTFKIPGPDLTTEISGSLFVGQNGDISRMNFEGSLGLTEKLVLLSSLLGISSDADAVPVPFSIKGAPKNLKIMLADKDLSPFLAPILSDSSGAP